MTKGRSAVAKPSRNISQQKLIIGLDLGDRQSWYCVVDQAGQIQLEQRVRTTARALREVFGAMPRSQIALETRTHSPWISRLPSARVFSQPWSGFCNALDIPDVKSWDPCEI